MGYNIESGGVGGGGGSTSEVTLVPVRVQGIILDERHEKWESLGGWDSLGTIFYSGVHETTPETTPNVANVARPLFPNLKQYPLLNEIVLIVKATNRNIYGVGKGEDTYYLPSLNIWSHQHHNALPTKAHLNQGGDSKENDYKQTQGGAVRQVEDGSTDITLGRYFNEQINIKPLLPYEGDYIIEGRYGNSIRFGGSVKDEALSETTKNDWSQGDEPIGTPITIIRNGQSSELDEKGWVPTIEDINRDDSSIYMTSNQKISSLVVASTNFQSYESEIEIPTDTLTSLVDPPLPEVKEPEAAPPTTDPQDLDQDATLQDLEDSPPTPTVEIESTPDTPQPPLESTDSLSFYDELINSGQTDGDAFIVDVEFEERTDSGTVGVGDNFVYYPPSTDTDDDNTAGGYDSSGEAIGNRGFKLGHFIRSNTAIAKGIDNTPGVDANAGSSYSESYIINNLKALMENVGDIVYDRYPNMKITSAFRSIALNRAITGSITSEHAYGRAMDIQVPGVKASEVFNYIVDNVPKWNQLIWERPEIENEAGGEGAWVHVSYGSPNRKRTTLFSKSTNIHTAYGGETRSSGRYQDNIKTAKQEYV